MSAPLGTIRALRSALANNQTSPMDLAERALANANGNANRNTYLWQNPEWIRAEAQRVGKMPFAEGGAFGDGRSTLWGLPIAVKDCFDLAGSPTTCGTYYYREKNGIAQQDSWVVERLRTEGAVIIGKTHLHPLAYGITGENPDFKDCGQPGNDGALTGGSSSGSAAAVMEGSAVAAIGTDTGGSIRVPAALCGLTGYRASHGRGNWKGGAHLAQSFDTLGWLFTDPEEAPLLGSFFHESPPKHTQPYKTFATVNDEFLWDCEPGIAESYRDTVRELEGLGLQRSTIDAGWWRQAQDVFAPIQAWEAARLHWGNFEAFEPSIQQRLEWGARITPSEIAELRVRRVSFRTTMDGLFYQHGLIMLPASPIATLAAGADHSETRQHACFATQHRSAWRVFRRSRFLANPAECRSPRRENVMRPCCS